jgi:hypothetical protein
VVASRFFPASSPASTSTNAENASNSSIATMAASSAPERVGSPCTSREPGKCSSQSREHSEDDIPEEWIETVLPIVPSSPINCPPAAKENLNREGIRCRLKSAPIRPQQTLNDWLRYQIVMLDEWFAENQQQLSLVPDLQENLSGEWKRQLWSMWGNCLQIGFNEEIGRDWNPLLYRIFRTTGGWSPLPTDLLLDLNDGYSDWHDAQWMEKLTGFRTRAESIINAKRVAFVTRQGCLLGTYQLEYFKETGRTVHLLAEYPSGDRAVLIDSNNGHTDISLQMSNGDILGIIPPAYDADEMPPVYQGSQIKDHLSQLLALTVETQKEEDDKWKRLPPAHGVDFRQYHQGLGYATTGPVPGPTFQQIWGA